MSSLWELITSVNTLVLFGIASGVLSTFAYIPYILDTIAKRTQPQRASWLIWSVLGSIAVFSQIYEGATASLWFAGVQVSGTIIVFCLSIRSGSGGFLSRNDYYILFAAAIGLVLWYFTENAAYALAITISISLLGGLATAIKAFYHPESETLSTWVVSFIASACAMISVGKMDFVLLAYPVYLFTLYLIFIVAIVLGRARRASTTVSAGILFYTRPMRATLRTTADLVIVLAALVYLFNHAPALFNSNTATKVTLIPEQDRLLPAGTFTPDSTILAFSSDKRTAEEFLTASSYPAPASGKLASAIDFTSPADPGSGRDYFSAKHYYRKQIADSTSNTHTPVKVEAATTLKRSVTKVPFLQLDSDDPYAQLVVTNGSALLLTDINDQEQFTPVASGAQVAALATNGEWFRVVTTSGEQGYLHRSEISVAVVDPSRQS